MTREKISDAELLLQCIWQAHLVRHKAEHPGLASKMSRGQARESVHRMLERHKFLDVLLAIGRYYAEDYWVEFGNPLSKLEKHIALLARHAKMAPGGKEIGTRKNAIAIDGDEDFERERRAFERRWCKG
jgi:hypothetical protein